MSAGTVTPSAPQPPAPRSPRRKRWLKRLLPLFTLLILVLWFAPAVVAKTNLRNTIARQALADVKGSVEVGNASLGWFAPIELRDVTIKDEAGRPVASVAKIRSQKTLVNLARALGDPGQFTVENPTISIVFEKDATNVEGVFAEYLKETPSTGATRVPVSVKVTGGTLTLLDAEAKTSTSVEGIDATLSVPASRAEPVAVQLAAATGGLNVEASVGEAGTAKLASKDFALGTLAPLLKRADPSVKLTGTLGTDLKLSWSKDAKGQPALAVAGAMSGKQLALSAPWLKGDELRFDSVELPLDVELAGRNLRVRAFDLKCDAGTVSMKGAFDPEQPPDSLIAQPGVSVEAHVNVATVLAKLPKLFKLRNGTELHEGQLDVKLTSQADPVTGAVWNGSVNTSPLKATVPDASGNKRQIVWNDPLKIEFVGSYKAGQLPTFKKLECTAEFISVNAASSPETLQVSANVLLGKLGTRLKEFANLDEWSIDGTAFASLAARRQRDGNFDAEVIVRLANLALVDQHQKGLREPALEAQVNAKGTIPADGPMALTTATAKLTAGGDQLDFNLTEPVADFAKLSSGSADVHLKGQVASWKDRVGAAVSLPVFKFTGAIDARGKAKFSAERVTVDRLQVTLTKPKLERWIALDESSMSAVGDLVFTRANRTATVTDVTLNSDTLKATKGTLAFELPAKGDPVISGNGQCTVDLNRLGRTAKLYTDPNGPDALAGTGVGPLKFRTVGNVTEFSGTLAVANFGYGPKDRRVWEEPTLQLDVAGKYDNGSDTLTLAGVKAERPGFTLNTQGTLAKLTTTGDVKLTGTLRYDWEKLNPLMRKFAGNTFTATGTGSRGFVLSGQLEPSGTVVATLPAPKVPVPGTLAGLTGEASAGWHSLNAYGLDVGTVEVNAKMTRGVVKVDRIYTTVAGGKATIEPTLDLSTGSGAATVTKGAVIDRAKITTRSLGPDGALRFALPAFSGALQADGEFSAAIEDNRVALGDVDQTTAKGVLLIHRATVGLTPVAAQVANLLGAKDTAMTLANETAVTVRVEKGRVYHENFAMRISGTTFRTSGSVGFDQSLDLVVDVPLPKEFVLLKNNPVLQKAVSGKVLRVPLKGTLTKPELDLKALNAAIVALAREGAKEAGRDLIERELKNALPGAGDMNSKDGKLPFRLPFGKNP